MAPTSTGPALPLVSEKSAGRSDCACCTLAQPPSETAIRRAISVRVIEAPFLTPQLWRRRACRVTLQRFPQTIVFDPSVPAISLHSGSFARLGRVGSGGGDATGSSRLVVVRSCSGGFSPARRQTYRVVIRPPLLLHVGLSPLLSGYIPSP